MKSSLSRSRLLSCSLAARSSRVACSSDRDFSSSSREWARSCEASSRICITSSSAKASSSTTEATITRAEALPIAPASWVSTNCTSLASGGIGSIPRTPVRRA
ncbi:hypothetical protein LP416_08780 [Polaromonas sp. P2-4]|nr:hypothetical protein LP416_08780 [Polaromonas sp. P2-4]